MYDRTGFESVRTDTLDALDEWARYGRPQGGFITKVLRGDYESALAHADHGNRAAFPMILAYAHAQLPEECHGSEEHYASWAARDFSTPVAEDTSKPAIFCWVNNGAGTDWQVVEAMSEDGVFLASHCSSHESWAKHDIGLTSDWKHDIYRRYYPDGYRLVWVDPPILKHPGLAAAYAKHTAMTKEEYEAKAARAKEPVAAPAESPR